MGENNIDLKELVKLYSTFQNQEYLSRHLNPKFKNEVNSYLLAALDSSSEENIKMEAGILPYLIPLINLKEAN